MKPRGPLMIEHRLIEKMLNVVNTELENIKKQGKVNTTFIYSVIDFIRTYADRTHHGKEEDILFMQLDAKELNETDKKNMNDLMNEHIMARKAVGALHAAVVQYEKGDEAGISIIIEKLSFLIKFYPVHIQKEDKVFFPDTEKYFTQQELDKMLKDFWEFDRKMIHEKYSNLYMSLKDSLNQT